MDAGVTSLRSILDKPLPQLTEEDISQLTREDCRKYLKEKGMRRPSWNKSQAIQQVISLKALLETSEDSGAGALRKILLSKPQAPATLCSGDSVKEPGGDANNNISSESVECTVPVRVDDSPGLARLESGAEEADYNFFASSLLLSSGNRSPSAVHRSIGQLAIFYSGKVNVYDTVPPKKAQAIMHLAASPIQVSLDDTNFGNTAPSFPCHLQTPEKMIEDLQQCWEKGNMTHGHEGQASRKLSLQRYLQKRKDRGRFRVRKCSGPTYSSLEVYLNHRLKRHTSNGRSPHIRTSSPTHPAVQHTLYSSAENDTKVANFSVDLNEDALE